MYLIGRRVFNTPGIPSHATPSLIPAARTEKFLARKRQAHQRPSVATRLDVAPAGCIAVALAYRR